MKKAPASTTLKIGLESLGEKVMSSLFNTHATYIAMMTTMTIKLTDPFSLLQQFNFCKTNFVLKLLYLQSKQG